MESHEVKSEVRDKANYLNTDDGTVVGLPPRENIYEEDVTPDMRLVSDRFAEELQRMRTDSDPGWDGVRDAGRINLKRVMAGDDIDTVFDVWDSDKQDSTRTAAALAIDCSGSMEAVMDTTCQIGWVIKHAIETIEGTCSEAAYDWNGGLMYGPLDRADEGVYKTVTAQGGTTVNPTLVALLESLMQMTEPNKILFVVTDGSFHDTQLAKNTLKAATEAGVNTVLVMLGYYSSAIDEYKQCCNHVKYINTIEELIPYAETIVTAQLAAQADNS